MRYAIVIAIALYFAIAAYPSFCKSVDMIYKEFAIEMMVGAV